MPVTTRFEIAICLCEDTLQGTNFHTLAKQFASLPRSKRCIIDGKLLTKPGTQRSRSLPQLTAFQQLLFPITFLPTIILLLFLTLPSTKGANTNITVDVYFIGDIDVSAVNPFVASLQHSLELDFTNPIITWRRRLHLRTSTAINNAVFALTLIEYIHSRHCDYLHLSPAKLVEHNINLVEKLQVQHDQYLRQLDHKKLSTFPFVSWGSNKKDPIDIPRALGWVVIDVLM